MNPDPPSTYMARSEFLVFAAVCDLREATTAEVQARLADHYAHNLASEIVAVLLLRVMDKGWLYNVASNGNVEPRFTPTAAYTEALASHFRRFLREYAMDRPEAFVVLRAELRAAADDTAT